MATRATSFVACLAQHRRRPVRRRRTRPPAWLADGVERCARLGIRRVLGIRTRLAAIELANRRTLRPEFDDVLGGESQPTSELLAILA